MRRATPTAALFALALVVTACTPTRWEKPEPPAPVATAPGPAITPTPAPPRPPGGPTPGGPGNPPFYDVFGQRYFVLPGSEGFRERGEASWYGEPFHGRRTSSGAVYDMYELTAAHKTLPLPTLVRVTHLENGRSVVVKVNDRGPFAKGRVIDLSYAAAKALDMVQSGTAPVEVVALTGPAGAGPVVVENRAAATLVPASLPAPALIPAQRLFMQVGAFGDAANAERLRAKLESNGVTNVVIRYDDSASPALYRVRIGPIADSADYDALASRVRSLRIPDPSLVTESLTPGTGAGLGG